MILRWIVVYLNHIDQSLPVFNLNIITDWSFSCFFCWAGVGDRGEGVDRNAEKINVKNKSRKFHMYEQ